MRTARYTAYAAAHSVSPELMLMRDRLVYVGGPMAGFIAWLGRQWSAWKMLTQWRGASPGPEDHTAFDAWLSASFPTCQ